MKHTIKLSIHIVVIMAFVLSTFAAPVFAGEEQGGKRKIVVFQEGLNDQAKDELIRHTGGVKEKDLDLIGAKVVFLPNKASEEALEQNPEVLRVDDDVIVEALNRKTVSSLAQTLPWGIDQIDAELVWPSGNSADPIKVGVIDTGISKDHPDLKANIKGGVNTIRPRRSWNDDNGHGSHVAGTIAALNNGFGVVGAAPAADLYAIKVLGSNGSGFLSDVIEGIQWGVANGMQALNMSLGTSSDSQSMHDAVIAAKNAGVIVVAAAGNNGGAVIFPAAYPEVIAVSATDQNNQLASFSSRGPEVDLSAPGVSIFSTYKGTAYAIASGTSMAAPHVTGSAALVLNTSVGAYDADADGVWDPDEVQKKLQDTAMDLGNPGLDNNFGYGLVQAYSAVQ